MRKGPLFSLFVLAALGACATPSPRLEGGKVRVFVSILPQADFVRHVGGKYVDVQVLVGAGQSHEVYEPTARQLADVSTATIFFSVGIPLEKALLPRVAETNPHLPIVNLSAGLPTISAVSCAEGHDHHEDSADFHTWLSPRNARIMVRSICTALSRVDPAHQAEYEKNCREYENALDLLDARIAKALLPLKGSTVLVYHPAFGYFCRDYGLSQVAVETEGKEPSAAKLAALIDEARQRSVKVVFVQPQFAIRSAEALAAAIGGAVVTIDPLPAEYIPTLDQMARTIESALRPSR